MGRTEWNDTDYNLILMYYSRGEAFYPHITIRQIQKRPTTHRGAELSAVVYSVHLDHSTPLGNSFPPSDIVVADGRCVKSVHFFFKALYPILHEIFSFFTLDLIL